MANTPMNNLRQNGWPSSSAVPGVSGESRNAPYGPKAFETDDVWSLKSESDCFDHAESGFRVGRTSGPSQSKDVSCLQPDTFTPGKVVK